MVTPINLLIVEDSPDDATLMVGELISAGFNPVWHRVETAPDFLASLEKMPDIILSDYRMPQFSGLKAMELLRASGRDIPLILVSGTVGEDLAVEAMKQGATDYLLKDRLGRLGSAVTRALCESRERNKLRRAQASLNLFRTLVDRSTDGIEVVDPETGRFLDINERTCQRLGYTREEMLSLTVPDIDPMAVTHGTWSQHLAGIRAAGSKVVEGVHRRKDGSIYPIEVHVQYVSLDRDYLIASVRDITERKRSDQALRESEEKFRQLAENIQEVFWMTAVDMQAFLYVSPAYEKIWGRTCASLYANPGEWLASVHPADYERVRSLGREKIHTGEYDIEYRIVRPDKGVRWIHDRAFPVRDAKGQVYRIAGTAEDITARKKVEEQLRQSQKMEGIGQLAGGVAHDFNNILAVIQMQSDLLLLSENISAEQLDYIRDISDSAKRAAALTRQLLLFSRREVLQPRDLDLSESITNMTRMLRRILGEDIQTQFKFAPQPLHIHADAGMLDQILMNLAVNSRDAMPEGGQLVIETFAIDFDDQVGNWAPQGRPGAFACLCVTDTGCGITPENLTRIFEPFFTTKEVGKGTGLGLATVFGIVQQHQGWVNVYSEVGLGTTFRIYLPRHDSKSQSPSGNAQFAEIRGGSETILLVEDDSVLRVSIRKALARLGYRVLEAASGQEALEVWKSHGYEIRLVLTDLIMPGGMNGKELGAQLLKQNPKLKIIYASGYSAEVAGKDFPLEDGVNFLTKPFEAHKLAQTVRSRLDAE